MDEYVEALCNNKKCGEAVDLHQDKIKGHMNAEYVKVSNQLQKVFVFLYLMPYSIRGAGNFTRVRCKRFLFFRLSLTKQIFLFSPYSHFLPSRSITTILRWTMVGFWNYHLDHLCGHHFDQSNLAKWHPGATRTSLLVPYVMVEFSPTQSSTVFPNLERGLTSWINFINAYYAFNSHTKYPES